MSRWVVMVVIVLSLGCAGLGGYVWWQHQQIGQLSDSLAGSGSASSSSLTAAASSASDTTASAAAYPAALAAQQKHLVLSLHMPTGYNVLDVAPTFGSQQAEYGFYVTGAGDILARWLFSWEGTSGHPAKIADGNDELDVTALDAWMKAADAAGVTYPDGSSAMSPAQKSAFVAKLKSDSAACSHDASRGFVTADKTFDVCVSLIKPPNSTTDWGLSVNGYGEPGGVAAYVRGVIDLPGSTASNNQSEAAQFVSELKQLAATVVSGAK